MNEDVGNTFLSRQDEVSGTWKPVSISVSLLAWVAQVFRLSRARAEGR